MVWQSDGDDPGNYKPGRADVQAGFLAVILDAMAHKRLSVRDLAGASGIGKSRLGAVLHSNEAKRPPLTVPELQMLLEALDIHVLHAWLKGEALRHMGSHSDSRLNRLFPLLSEFYLDLPRKLLAAMAEIDGADGTELRREWSGPLANAVARRIAHEIMRVIERRNALTDLRF